jgi:hypothetical protein
MKESETETNSFVVDGHLAVVGVGWVGVGWGEW